MASITSDPYLEDEDPTSPRSGVPVKHQPGSGMRQRVRLPEESTAVTRVVVDPEPDTEPDTPTFAR